MAGPFALPLFWGFNVKGQAPIDEPGVRQLTFVANVLTATRAQVTCSR